MNSIEINTNLIYKMSLFGQCILLCTNCHISVNLTRIPVELLKTELYGSSHELDSVGKISKMTSFGWLCTFQAQKRQLSAVSLWSLMCTDTVHITAKSKYIKRAANIIDGYQVLGLSWLGEDRYLSLGSYRKVTGTALSTIMHPHLWKKHAGLLRHQAFQASKFSCYCSFINITLTAP